VDLARELTRVAGVIAVVAVLFLLTACGGPSGGGGSSSKESTPVAATEKTLLKGLIPDVATAEVRLDGMPHWGMDEYAAQVRVERAYFASLLAKWQGVQGVSESTRVMLADWVQFLRQIAAHYKALEEATGPLAWDVETVLPRDMEQVGTAVGMDVAAELQAAKGKAAASTTTTATTPDDGASGGAYEQW
jgi:hypothetical protein